MKSLLINLFGGPSVGKSTCASELFSYMKKRGHNVENTYEFPKILAWDNNVEVIKDQFFVTANQHRNISRLYGKVEHIIVDSPIILGLIYKNWYDDSNSYPSNFYDETYDKFIFSLFKKYDSINIYLRRNNNKFEENGRLQNYEESLEIDKNIKKLLVDNDISFIEFDVDCDTVKKIYDYIIKKTI